MIIGKRKWISLDRAAQMMSCSDDDVDMMVTNAIFKDMAVWSKNHKFFIVPSNRDVMDGSRFVAQINGTNAQLYKGV